MITAIILAAGESRRMGEPKMLMPWGKSTVLQSVISTFQASGINDILVVTGGARQEVESLVGKKSAALVFKLFPRPHDWDVVDYDARLFDYRSQFV